MEIHGTGDSCCAWVSGGRALGAGWVHHDDGGLGGEKIFFENKVVSVWSEGDGLRRTVVAQLEDVIANEDGSVGAIFLMECEVELGECA